MRKKRKNPPPEPEPAGEQAELVRRLEQIHQLLITRRASEMTGLVEFLKSKRKLALTNFWLGLARGIGFFLGFTLIGAAVVAVTAYFVDFAATTFESKWDTQTLVRGLTEKYWEVMDEVNQVQDERQAGADVSSPSATGAQWGVLLAASDRSAAKAGSEQER